MKKKQLLFCFAFFAFFALSAQNTISLAGNWRFKTDQKNIGESEKWFTKTLDQTVKLPGSMLENNKGDLVAVDTKWTGSIYDSSWFFNPRMAKFRQPGNIKIPFWLTPNRHYVGAAWYQKEVTIPAEWKNKRVIISLERPHFETSVWVDNELVGTQMGFCVAQEFDLTKQLTPGKHTISLRIDNTTKAINVGPDSHSLTDHTQGNWNGIVGKMLLTATAKTWVEDVQVYPNIATKTAKVVIAIQSQNSGGSGKISISANSFNSITPQVIPAVVDNFKLSNGAAVVTIDLPMGKNVLLWDEFDPALYRLKINLTTNNGATNSKEVQFGMRSFKTNGTRFEVNGRPVHLRGTVENCIFPLTGYAPMDVAAWERVFKICKASGLNHMRFHSFCPPEAAFIAADKVGFYLQPEGPSWANHGSSLGDGKPIDQFIYDETNRISKAYGNYASFCMLAYGNEPRGGHQAEYLTKFIHYWKDKDSRRVYTGASVGQSWPLVPDNEYMVKAGPRGLSWSRQPESKSDYKAALDTFKVPYITHEMGQWCVYPNFKEIKKYTGVYQAKNFELFQEDLNDQGMGAQAEQFLMASGKLQALCYKAEIEKSLRTKDAGGFQLLQLNDYPGQGTALIGLLDPFWEEKGYISTQQFARFCNSTVPLTRMPKFVFTNNETFTADVEIYHYGKAPLQNATVSWTIANDNQVVIAKGSFQPTTIPIGNCFKVGSISEALAGIKNAGKYKLEVVIKNTTFANDWNFWVYPATLPTIDASTIYYTTSFNDSAKQVLGNGGKVFLNAVGKVVKGKEVVMNFTPVFWNTSWFKMRPPHTLGILCNPTHPALTDFPTSYHTDFNWWDVLNKAQVMHLEDFPKGFTPIIQPIDTWFLNRRLAVLFEAKVGKGKLVVSSADLSANMPNRPSAKQLFYSIQQYMLSDKFNPTDVIEVKTISDLFTTGSKLVFNAYTNGSPDELKPKKAIVQ